MGKILSALLENGTAKRPAAVSLAPVEPEEPAGEVAFIEFGPKRKVVAASPGVMPADKIPAPTPPPASAAKAVSLRVVPGPKKSKLAPELVAFHAAGQPAAAQYAQLLTALIEAARRKPGPCQVLLFTGTRHEAGCTTALLNVAIAAARAGHVVAAVDANLRRPGVAVRLGLDEGSGLAEVLASEVPLSDALRLTEQDGLAALTAGSPALADVNALAGVVAGLREAFDLVLIDGPRWDGRAGCVALAEVADAVFLVAPTAEADAPPASELMAALPETGVRLAGCVLTDR